MRNISKPQTSGHWTLVKRVPRTIIRGIIKLLPSSAPVTIYTKVLKIKPLRALTNRIMRFVIPEYLDIPEGRLFLNPSDPVVSGALAMGVYETYFSELFRKILSPDMIVIDIGANLGYYTLIASNQAKRVISFEPETDNFELLSKNIEFNKRRYVNLVQDALGDSDGLITLYLDPNNKGKHSMLPDKNNQSIEVNVKTLDGVLGELKIKNVSLIKLDIEGWEAKALLGMRQTLKDSRPIIFFEFVPDRIVESGEDPLATLESLVALGYQLFLIDESAHQTIKISDLPGFIRRHSNTDAFLNILASTKPANLK